MTRLRLESVLPACVLGLFLTTSAGAAVLTPFVIDDFNVDTGSLTTDSTVGSGVSTAGSVINGANIVMGGATGWTRTLVAELTAGDGIATEVCDTCQAGHVTMTGGGNPDGIGTYIYNVGTGSTVDMSGYGGLFFDWGATQAGASVDIIFKDGTNTTTAASWGSLANTGGSAPGDLVTQSIMAINWGAVNSNAITEIQFVVNGAPNMNSIIDNVTAVVPVPAAVWLFGSGLLGLAGIAKREKKA